MSAALYLGSAFQTNGPSTTKQTSDIPTFDSFSLQTLKTAVPSSSSTSRSFSYFLGSSFGTVYSHSAGYLSPELDFGMIGSNFSIDVFALYSYELTPPTSSFSLRAAIFVWKANGTLGIQIGTTQTAGLTDTSASYTLTFGNTPFPVSRCDKIYLELWGQINDSGGDNENSSVIVQLDGSSAKSKVNAPDGLRFETYRTGTPGRVGVPNRIGVPARIATPGSVKC